MADIPYFEPNQIRAGDTVQWKRTLSDYPASTWTLAYSIINSGAKYTATATADGQNHLVTITAATSATFTAGWYDWMATVTNGTTRVTIGNGRLQILPNLAVAETYDTRSHARKMLDAINAVLEGIATSGQIDLLSGALGTRQFSRDPEKLLKIRDKYRAEVEAEDAALRIQNGGTSRRRVQVRLNG